MSTETLGGTICIPAENIAKSVGNMGELLNAAGGMYEFWVKHSEPDEPISIHFPYLRLTYRHRCNVYNVLGMSEIPALFNVRANSVFFTNNITYGFDSPELIDQSNHPQQLTFHDYVVTDDRLNALKELLSRAVDNCNSSVDSGELDNYKRAVSELIPDFDLTPYTNKL